MRQEFGVAGETVAAEKERALVERRGRDRVETAAHAKLDRRLDVLARSPTGGGGFHARLDVRADVVEMVNEGRVETCGQRLVAADDLVTALQVEFARSVREQLR